MRNLGNSVDRRAESVFTTDMTTHHIERTTEGSEGQYLVATCSCGWNRSSVTPRGLTHAINSHRRAVALQQRLAAEAAAAVKAAGGRYGEMEPIR